jgi:hypothetical protein
MKKYNELVCTKIIVYSANKSVVLIFPFLSPSDAEHLSICISLPIYIWIRFGEVYVQIHLPIFAN